MNARVFSVTPVYNDIDHTLATVRTLLSLTPSLTEIVVVDNGSSDGTSDILREEHPEVTLLQGSEELLWSGAINIGVRYALEKGAEYVLIINNDLLLHPRFLNEHLIAAEAYPDALISPKILMTDEPWRIFSMGGKIDWLKGVQVPIGHNTIDNGRWDEPMEADWLAGMVILVPAQVFRQGIWIDELTFPHYSSDSDFCIRAKKAGFTIIVWPKSRVYNKVSSSGLDAKLLLGVEPFSLRLCIRSLTSIRSSKNLLIFSKWVKRHAPVWSWPMMLGRFYGFYFLKCLQVWLGLPSLRKGTSRKRYLKNTFQTQTPPVKKEMTDVG